MSNILQAGRLFSGTFLLFLFLLVGCTFQRQPQNAPTPATAFSPALTNGVETFDAVWQIVYDTHFDRSFNGADWNAIREELRPKAASARSERELQSILQEMLNRLGHSHMGIIPSKQSQAVHSHRETESSPAELPEDSSGDVGLEIRWVNHQAVVFRVEPNSPAEQAGIRSGWVLQAIQGRPVEKNTDNDANSYEQRLLRVESWAMLQKKLKGPLGSKVNVSFLNAKNQPVTVTLQRSPSPGMPVKFGNLPTLHTFLRQQRLQTASGAQIGLIRFNIWMPTISPAFSQAMDALKDADGIIIDLRGNVGGLGAMVMGISGHFLEDPKVLGTMKTRDGELQFVSNPRRVNQQGERVQPFAGPVAILIDEVSLSTSEVFAGGMQAIGRARIFGQTTCGQVLPAAFDHLPNGDVLVHAIGDFVTPKGVRLEGRGVLPDEPVALSRQDLLAGRDASLNAAMQWIQQQTIQKAAQR